MQFALDILVAIHVIVKKKVKIFVDYLNLRDVGLLEMTFALALMLSGFSLGGLPLSVLMWVILLAIVVLQGKMNNFRVYKPLLYLVVYWALHQVVILIADGVNLNVHIQQLIYFAAVFALFPNINIPKLKGCMNWVALISIAGLLYQWSEIARGNMVHQLEIPGLVLDSESIEKMSLRPSSFFQEPSAYTIFMICPLYFALMEKKYVWGISLILSIFLTTSTTGLIISFVILGASFISTGMLKVKSILLGASLVGVLYFALTNLEAFEAGVDKLENTDAETNVRLTQGRYVVSTMEPSEYVFGVPYSSAYSYCKAGRATNVRYFGESVYMPTFWYMLLLYGVVGLILYLNIYIQILRQSRRTFTLIFALCSVLFSSSYTMGIYFIFPLIILLVVVVEDQKYTGMKKQQHIKSWQYKKVITDESPDRLSDFQVNNNNIN